MKIVDGEAYLENDQEYEQMLLTIDVMMEADPAPDTLLYAVMQYAVQVVEEYERRVCGTEEAFVRLARTVAVLEAKQIEPDSPLGRFVARIKRVAAAYAARKEES